ncbi:MAG TPA: hypothetical protein VF588_22000 [Pyrinomonadaceae bacterium]|jgi:hypothetical protein
MENRLEKLEKELRLLKVYAGAATLCCAVLLFAAFAARDTRQKFEEIDVERINVVEKDGKLRMVISNEARQHPGIVNGKIIKRDYPRAPGMIFFNHLGDEMGGFVFGENGGKGHSGSLTFDKVRNDQAIGFRYLESDNGTYATGLEVWQQPNVPSDVLAPKWEAARKIADPAARKAAVQELIDRDEATQQRLFLGKLRDNSTLLLLNDIKGRPRVRMQVAPDGAPKLEFLDEAGKVVQSLPERPAPPKP